MTDSNQSITTQENNEEKTIDYFDYKAINSVMQLLCMTLTETISTMYIKSSLITLDYVILHIENICDVYNKLLHPYLY